MSSRRRETRLAFWFLLPVAVVLTSVVAYPFFYNVYVSLTNWNMYHFRNPELKGFAHYGRLLMEPEFFHIFGKTVGQGQDCVIRTGIPVYGNPVKGI